MDFKNVKTYGRFKNRVIKTDLWVSPQVQRNRLFVSTSSESSMNSSGNKSEMKNILAVSVDIEQTGESLSSEKIASTAESIPSEEKCYKGLSNGTGRNTLPLSSSSGKDDSPLLFGHSTPYSRHSQATVRPRRLPVISPLVATDSPMKAKLNQFDSPDIFSDASQERCDLSANEKSSNRATSNEAIKNGDMSNSANKTGDAYAATNEMKDSCNTAKNEEDSCNIDWTNELIEKDLSLKSVTSDSSARTSLEVEIKLQRLSSADIKNISDKVKSLSLNGDFENSNFNADISNTNECEMSDNSCYEAQDLSVRNKFSSRRDMCNNSKDTFSLKHLSDIHNVVCDERLCHSDFYLNEQTCEQSIPARIGSAPFESKTLDDSSRERMNSSEMKQRFEKVQENVAGKNVDDLTGKNQMETNNSNTNFSEVPHDECQKEDVSTIDTYQVYQNNTTKTAYSANTKAISNKFGGLRLLDAKVYLNKKDGLKSSISDTVKSYPKKLASQNSSGTVDVNGDAHAPRYSRDAPLELGSNNVFPVGGPPQHSASTSGKIRFAEEVTSKTSDIHTPVSGQHTGRIVKDPHYSSFKDALTPATFQQGRKRPLSPKQKILAQCEQQKPLKFTEILSASVLGKCVKVGEGTYGEVYKTNDGVEDVALKVIPVEGNFTVNDEPQKSFEEMIPEIVISKELSNLGECDDVRNAVYVCSNFVKVKRVMLVQDTYPEKLLQEWDNWKNNHNCENERPDMFQPDQYFVVFEFMNGGEDMERFKFTSMDEALSVLQQVAISLSVAEECLSFEHRDLHWGNVLIKRTKCKEIHYKLCGKDICVKSAGVFVSIIDFTLSRLTKDGVTVFCDLSKDPDIFKGKGDYQFQVYRLMRKANNNNWECHNPYSNVLWIRYLIDKVLNTKKYKKANNSIQRNIRTYLRQVLSYESALQAVQDGFLGLVFNAEL